MTQSHIILISLFTLMSCAKTDNNPVEVNTPVIYTNSISTDRMTLVLSAPSIHDTYYRDRFDAIVNFQVNYVNAIIGNDNVIILADRDTRPYFEGRVPNDILLTVEVQDIWMRDFTTVNPMNPVQFVYSWASMSQSESVRVQRSFARMADLLGLERKQTHYILDGGNVVDNYAGKAIVTSRFLEDNDLSMEQARTVLKDLLGAGSVAIILPDDEVLAHADGMVMWADETTLLLNDYSEFPDFRAQVLAELESSFPDVRIVEVPVTWDNTSSGGIGSACGINVNATTTHNTIYVPVFNGSNDAQIIETMRNESSKKIVSVDATGVCVLGGSVRCLTWQLAGSNAEKIILAAREN